MNEITIRVIGSPAPQGSKRFVGRAKNGRGIMIESSAKVKPWREAVVWAVREFLTAEGRLGMSGVKLARCPGPIHVDMIFTFFRPKSAPKRRLWPDRKPDLSKLVRSTEDALTEAGVIEDDARIVRCVASKVYAGEGTDALDVAGAVIRIRSAE